MKLDLKTSLDYPFEDPEWPKTLGIVGLSAIFPLTTPQSIGFMLDIVRSTADGEDKRLPSLNRWGKQWLEGFWITLVGMVALTVLIFGLTAFYIAFMPENGNDLTMVILTIAAAILIGLLFLLVFSTLAPALLLRYALQRNVASLFDVPTAISDIKLGFWDYMLLSSVPVLGSIASILVSGTVIGVLAVPLISAVTIAVQGKMLGDYYRAYFD